MIRRWMERVVRYRLIVIVFTLTVTIFTALGLKKLYFYNRLSDWLPKDDVKLKAFIDTSKKFSVNEMVLILIRPDAGVFSRDTLERVMRLTESLLEKKEIFSVISLANIADIKKIPDGISVSNLLDHLPENDGEMGRFREYVLGNETFCNRVISSDGNWLAFTVSLVEKHDVIQTVSSIVIPETDRAFAGRGKVLYTGMPADGHFINQYTQSDLKRLVPLMILLITIILYFSFRSGKGVFYPLLVVVISNIWLFGVIGHLHRPLTIIMPALPVLLIALGSAYALYVLNKIQHDYKGPTVSKTALISGSTAAVFIPILFAGLTDIVGFISFKTVPLKFIADFGVFSGLGLFFALVITLTLLPAMASFSSFQQKRNIEDHRVSRILDRSSDWIIRRPKTVLWVAFVLMGIVGCFALRLKKEVGFSEFYPRRSQPRQAVTLANRLFDGAYPLSLTLKNPNVKSPESLRLIRRLESYLYSIPHLSMPLSIGDTIAELNFQLNDAFALPETQKAVGNLWFFLEGRAELSQIISKDDRETLVFAKISDPTTDFNSRLYKALDAFIRRETSSGFIAYRLNDFSDEASQIIRKAECDYLAEEMAWIFSHRVPSPPDRRSLGESLWKNTQRAIDPVLSHERMGQVWREYLRSPEFEFPLSAASADKLLEQILQLQRSNGLDEKGIVERIRKHLPPKAFDAKAAAYAASSIVMKGEEALRKLKVESAWKELSSRIPDKDMILEKQVHSLLYDLEDNLALLPAGEIHLPGGQPLSVDSVDHTGFPVLLTKMADFLFLSQIQSILLAYIVTLLMMILMRRSVSLGFISTIPIIFTSIVMYGFLGLAGLPLDYATMMIGSISIGVGIDYTIHFIYVTTDEFKRGKSLHSAIKVAFIERGKVIISNSAAVIAGFAVLFFSSMRLLANFGATMVLAMAIASLAALSILPAALLVFKPKILRKTDLQK